MGRPSNLDKSLAEWLDGHDPAAAEGPGSIADVPRVRVLLVAAAREGRALSYSELLGQLGHRFTRPKMRALCKTLDAIDTAGAAAGEPPLAVLVVREGDGLPGQGWWVGAAARSGYAGQWTGPGATALVRAEQARAFAYWDSALVGTFSPAIVAEASGSPKGTCRRSA
ncbi:ribose-phosphate pyrophosphokinase [Sphingomonas sp.]|uniref:ribose-phosphate pyrophosphokinase n=1 Tax=Sphingomonas sp. TaxID=28214 RepID=UPI003CC63E50